MATEVESNLSEIDKHIGVYEALFNEPSQNKFHSFEELNQKCNNIKFLELV